MMSVPIATCTVTGMSQPRRRREDAAARELRLPRVEKLRHRLPEAESRRRRPPLIASFSSRPVSSAMPKRPGPSASSTSSEVATDERDLEVVNDGGAVGRDRRDEAAFHQVDQHGPERRS